MPSIASIGTYLPCWATQHRRAVGDDIEPAWPAAPILVTEAGHDKVRALCTGEPRQLPTTGASSGLFALAAPAESDTIGPLVAVEQAGLSGITVTSGEAQVIRCERGAWPCPSGTVTSGIGLQLSPAVHERVVDAKERCEAGKFAGSEDLDFPPRTGTVAIGARIGLAHNIGGLTTVSALTCRDRSIHGG